MFRFECGSEFVDIMRGLFGIIVENDTIWMSLADGLIIQGLNGSRTAMATIFLGASRLTDYSADTTKIVVDGWDLEKIVKFLMKVKPDRIRINATEEMMVIEAPDEAEELSIDVRPTDQEPRKLEDLRLVASFEFYDIKPFHRFLKFLKSVGADDVIISINKDEEVVILKSEVDHHVFTTTISFYEFMNVDVKENVEGLYSVPFLLESDVWQRKAKRVFLMMYKRSHDTETLPILALRFEWSIGMSEHVLAPKVF